MAGGQDVAFLDVGGPNIDIDIQAGDLVAENGLETAVLVSLYSDRYVPPEELPAGFAEAGDPRGWWADAIAEIPNDRIGSRFWLLARGKINNDTANQMREFAQEALAWMIEAGFAARIDTSSLVTAGESVQLFISILRPSGAEIPLKFLWDGQALKRSA